MKLNFSFWDSYSPIFFEGMKTTVVLSIAITILALAIGVLLYFMKASHMGIGPVKPFRIIAMFFIEIMRGTPVLLQVLMAYSGIKILFGINISAPTAAVVAIALNSSVYVAEIIRAGIEAVDAGQAEAARSLGMTWFQAMKLVIMPQALKNILPALGNEFVSIIKGSSMAYVLGVSELTFSAKIVQGATYLPLEPLMISALFYLVLTFTLGRLVAFAERRMKTCD